MGRKWTEIMTYSKSRKGNYFGVWDNVRGMRNKEKKKILRNTINKYTAEVCIIV